MRRAFARPRGPCHRARAGACLQRTDHRRGYDDHDHGGADHDQAAPVQTRDGHRQDDAAGDRETAVDAEAVAQTVTEDHPEAPGRHQRRRARCCRLVNSERAKAGCRAVRANSALKRAAQGHSADMAAKDYFSHTSKDGRTFADRIRAAGYPGGTIGENIAAGQTTASAVMRSWMGSSGHRANILNCSFTALGVGYARGGSYGYYWTQDFGG